MNSEAFPRRMSDKPALPLSRILLLSAFWWGTALWLYEFILLMVPIEVASIVSKEKLDFPEDAYANATTAAGVAAHAGPSSVGEESRGTALGIVLLLGALLSTIVSPFVGAWSDQVEPWCWMGRRGPFLVVGSVCAALASIGMLLSTTFWSYTLSFTLVQLSLGSAQAPFNGLVADLVPMSQRGLISGVIGASVALGNIVGALFGLLAPDLAHPWMYLITFVLLIASSLLTACFAGESFEPSINAPAERACGGVLPLSPCCAGIRGQADPEERAPLMSDAESPVRKDPILHRTTMRRIGVGNGSGSRHDGSASPERSRPALHRDTSFLPFHGDESDEQSEMKERYASDDATGNLLGEEESFLDPGRPREFSAASPQKPRQSSPASFLRHCWEVCTCYSCRKWLREFLSAFSDHDFRWVFISRLFIQLGIYTVQEYLLFYVKYAVDLPEGLDPREALSLVMLPLLLFALMAPVLAGWMSDAIGGQRKRLLYFAGGIMIVVCMVLSVNRSWTLLPWLGAVFGVAYGTFNSIDFALALDVLPTQESAARDLGLWNLALAVPMCIAAPIAGLLLDTFNQLVGGTFGFTVLFLLASVYLALGVVSVTRLQGVK